MVVVDSSCLCESVTPITMAPIEIRYILLCVSPGTAAEAGDGQSGNQGGWTVRKPRGEILERGK